MIKNKNKKREFYNNSNNNKLEIEKEFLNNKNIFIK